MMPPGLGQADSNQAVEGGGHVGEQGGSPPSVAGQPSRFLVARTVGN